MFQTDSCYGDRITATPAVMSHDSSQIPRDHLVTVISLLQALLLLLVISSLPNLLNAWYSALYCPSDHSDINADVNENLIKHFMRTHDLMLRNISKTVMASIKKRRRELERICREEWDKLPKYRCAS